MDKNVALILTIVILTLLLAIFFVSFVIYKKTPVPEGCEKLEINFENCSACAQHDSCQIAQKKESK